MPQYRSNQFVSDWLKPQAGEWQNAPFQYPRRVVRTTDVDANGNRTYAAKQLDRGFMRSLMTETTSPTTGLVTQQQKQRFNFQFNPAAIQQEVQMRQDIYLPILQDPTQFAQPMSAVATFNFELLLDRTMEVGNGATVTGVNQSPEERRNLPQTDPFGEANPSVDVYQIGVLSDLQVLYSIIGQGFSNKFIESQLEQMKTQAKIDAKYAENPETTQSDIDSMTVDKFEANFGNNAFLIPMPVRVVFSELFMVDGFITSTSVRFTKFNTNMVPIQASIGLSMNALYIGFAKEKTFLTVQLENAKNIALGEANANIDEQNELLAALTDSAKQYMFTCDYSSEWSQGLGTNSSAKSPVSRYVLEGSSDDSKVEFKVGFKDAKTKGNNDKVLALFNAGKVINANQRWSFSVYGPYTSQSAAQADATNSRISTGINRVGYYYGEYTASDAKTWEDYRARNIRSDNPITTNSATNKLTGSHENHDLEYFVVWCHVTLSFNGVTLEFEDWKALRGDGFYRLDKPIQWPAPTINPAGISSVSGTGYAKDFNQIQGLSF